jgi:hypothetical protein
MQRGVHAAALDVDGAVGLPRITEGVPEEDPDHFVSTEAICDELVHLVNQLRDAWTFTVDLSPSGRWTTQKRTRGFCRPAPLLILADAQV